MSEVIGEVSLQKIKQKNLIVLYVINVIHGVVIGFFNSVYQPQVWKILEQDFPGNAEFLVGVVQSTGFVCMIMAMYASSYFSELIGRKSMILIGSVIFTGGFLFLFYGINIYLLIVGSMLVWGGFGCVDPSWVATISQNAEEHRKGWVYGLIFFFFAAGSIIGSFIVNRVLRFNFDQVNFFLFSAGGLILEGLIQGIFLTEKGIFQRKTRLEKRKEKKIWKIYRENPALLKLLGFFMLDAFVWGITFQLYYTSLVSSENGLGFETAELALYVVMVVNIGNLILQIPSGWLADKIGTKKSFAISNFSGLFFIILNIIIWFLSESQRTPVLIIAQIFWAVVIVTFMPAQNKIISKVYPERTAEVYGFMNFVRNILWFSAGYLAGWILNVFGFIGPLIFGLIGVIGEIIFLFVVVDEKKLLPTTSEV